MKELSLNILDITKNSVTAGAKNIEISLIEDENGILTLSIKDDGCGMLVSSAGAKVNKEAVGNGDILHFSRDGLHLLGKRYLEAFEKLTQK